MSGPSRNEPWSTSGWAGPARRRPTSNGPRPWPPTTHGWWPCATRSTPRGTVTVNKQLSPRLRSRKVGTMDHHTSLSLLQAYDDQLRTDAETPGALSVDRLGPLRLVTFPGGRGFVTYRDLGGADADGIAGLVGRALDHF